jgi:hypothetical protein
MEPVTLDEMRALHPAQVRVTKADRSVVIVESPRLDQGRLLGFVDGNYQAMPVGDVARLLVPRPAHGRTAAVIAGAVLGVSAFAYLMFDSGGGADDPCLSASSECEAGNPDPD